MTTKLTLRLDPSVLDAVDEARGPVPRTRWIADAIATRLKSGDGPQKIASTTADRPTPRTPPSSPLSRPKTSAEARPLVNLAKDQA